MEGSLEVLNLFGVSVMCRHHASDGKTVMFTARPGAHRVLSGHANVSAKLGWFYHFCKARIQNPAPNLWMYLHTPSPAQLL